MLNFIILYFSNLVLDYPLQGSFLAEWKQKNNYILFVHCAIWALGLSIVLLPLGLFAWWKVVMLLVGHYVIDYWKCRRLYKKWPLSKRTSRIIEYDGSAKRITDERVPYISDIQSLYIDQFLHVIQILLCLI
jgi:hypothetical protein